MMSVVPVDPPGQIDVAHSATLTAAIQRAADLSQYTATQLSQTYNWVVGYAAGQAPAQMAASIGATSQGPTNLIANSVVFSFPASVTAQDAANRLATLGGKTFDFPLVPIDRTTYSFVPAGSLFPQEWHLQNTGQVGGTPGADANVLPVWATGDLGQGTIIGVVDSGVYGAHPDLAPNYRSDLSYNFLEDNYDATPPAPIGPEDSHGTEVAGVAAASGTTLDGTVGVSASGQYCRHSRHRRPDHGPSAGHRPGMEQSNHSDLQQQLGTGAEQLRRPLSRKSIGAGSLARRRPERTQWVGQYLRFRGGQRPGGAVGR